MLLFLLASSSAAKAQSNAVKLENKKDRLEKSIEYADLLITDVRQQKQASLEDLALLQSKIDARKKLIDSYLEKQQDLMDSIYAHLFKANEVNAKLEELKDEYVQMINSAWQNHDHYKRLLYVLAAEDPNQAFSRLNYYKYYARQRNRQIERISATEADYLVKAKTLEQKVAQNQDLINTLNDEYAKLDEERDLKNTWVSQLNARVKELRRKQERDKNSALVLEEKVKAVIDEENRTRNPIQSDPLLLSTPTPEETLSLNSFEDNYGKLPWPLERGIVSAGFGELQHPDLENVKTNNNGINFLSQKGTVARAVFRGEVSRVLAVPGFNYVVIVRHGDFLSVYSNLAEVEVEKGMRLETKQQIGTVFTNKEALKTELHFEIWKGKELQNPALWLAPAQADEAYKE